MGLINEVNNINATLNANEQNRRRRERQKRIDKIFYSNATKLLVDNLIVEIENTGNYNIIYLDNIKDKVIDKTIYIDMAKRYKMENNDIEDLNFYLDDNYVKIANKTITIEKKKQKALEQETENQNISKISFLDKINLFRFLLNYFILFISLFAFFYFTISLIIYII